MTTEQKETFTILGWHLFPPRRTVVKSQTIRCRPCMETTVRRSAEFTTAVAVCPCSVAHSEPPW